MSRMGSAVQWVQENGLENDPKALQKYLTYLEKVKNKNNGYNKRSKTERQSDTADSER